MIHFTTFFALVVGGMEVIQPAAAAGVLAGLSPRTNTSTVSPKCDKTCNAIWSSVIALNNTDHKLCPIKMCCTKHFAENFTNCTVCVFTQGYTENYDFSTFQDDQDKLYLRCKKGHRPIEYITYPGQNPNRALPSTDNTTSSTSLPNSESTPLSTDSSITSPLTQTTPNSKLPTSTNPIVASPPTQSISSATPNPKTGTTPAAAPAQSSGNS